MTKRKIGIAALDERIEGLRTGGLYLIAGAPGSGRLVALMQFLKAGLDEGKVGLVTAAPPSRIFEESAYWGFGLEDAWRAGTLRLLTLGEDFERRLTSAADPTEVYVEMGELLGTDVSRIALYPGSPLWDTRSGTSFSTRFLRWVEGSGATVLGSISGTLDESQSPATESVLQASTGILLLEALPDGLRRFSIQRFAPAPKDDSPVTVDLVPEKGFVEVSGQSRRRRAQLSSRDQRNMLILSFAPEVPPEVRTWATKHHIVEEVDEPFRAIELVQETPDRYGVVLIHLQRDSVEDALRACRLIRRLSGVPIVMLTEEPVRSSDRLNGLHAGANDFMNGPISVLELASRIDQAVIAGGRPAADDRQTPGEQVGGTRYLPAAELSAEVGSRLQNQDNAPFTFVHLATSQGSRAETVLRKALLSTIRGEEGDRVGALAYGIGVILHGSPIKQVPAFVKRIESCLGMDKIAFDWKAFASAVDGNEIRRLVAGTSAKDRLKVLKSAS